MGQYFCKLYKQKEVRVLMHGLDAAGKTTILYHLKLGEVVTTIPTIGFNVETVQHGKLSLTAWDVGGRDKIRPLYRHYYPNTQALLFVIDSNDKERLDQISDEIQRVLQEDELREAVILILANKQDIKTALTLDEVKEGIEYDKIVQGHRERAINIFGCSAVTKEGQQDLHRALDWLCDKLAPKSTGWWGQPIKTSTANQNMDKNVSDTDNVEKNSKKMDDGNTEDKINRADSKKRVWSLGSYLKDTMASFKKGVPSLW